MIKGRVENKRKRSKENNSRLNFIMTIIFLLSLVLIGRLFDLQVMKHDYYVAMASDQHDVYSKLIPNRGRIFFQDNSNKSDVKLYPVATNKDFALVYAVPSMIENPGDAAEKLYQVFDQASIEKSVDNLLNSDDIFKATSTNVTAEQWKIQEEYKKIKRETEINARKAVVIDEYLKKLSKKDDPYEPLKPKVDDDKLKQLTDLNIKGIKYTMQSHRYYPEGTIGSQMLGFVGKSGDVEEGRYGLEGFFDDELKGKMGSVKTERAADGKQIIVNNREYDQPRDGSDLILTINRSIEYTVCAKLAEATKKHGASGGSAIMMEPKTGAIIAMCSWPDYDPNNYTDIKNLSVYNNPAIYDDYEPGSVFKAITIAAGIDKGVITPDSLYTDTGQIMIEGWHKPIGNSDYKTHGAWGVVDMTKVLEQSLNTGSYYVMTKVGPKNFADYVKKFGFGEKTGIEMETEAQGDIRNLLTNKIKPIEAATASFGQGITTTPLQMISAYAAIANGGILMKPYVVDEIVSADGVHQKTQPKQLGRVISERAALLVSSMLVKVVESGHSKHAAVEGYYVAGKTGTAQVADRKNGGYLEGNTIHTFIGFAPASDAKFVMLLKMDDPKDAVYAESTVVPLFKDIANFVLDYYQIPKQR